MARVTVSDDLLTVSLEGLDRLWALKGSITVPLRHVRGATADPGAAREPKGVRAPGLHVPGVAAVGTFHREGEKVLWAVHGGAGAVVIELVDEDYARLVIEVDDPRAVADEVNAAAQRAAT
jgi:hypothetical protein